MDDSDYKKMYYRLFNKMSDLIEEIKTAQQETEEMFISQREEEKVLYLHENEK